MAKANKKAEKLQADLKKKQDTVKAEEERLQKRASAIKVQERKIKASAAIKKERIRLEELQQKKDAAAKAKKMIECPKCHHKFTPKEVK